VITRVKDSATQATLTYPGSVQVRYTYMLGTDLTSVTDVSTNRTWTSTFDTKHNLTSVRTPLETGVYPLMQYDYTFDSQLRISQVTARYLRDDGQLVTSRNSGRFFPEILAAFPT